MCMLVECGCYKLVKIETYLYTLACETWMKIRLFLLHCCYDQLHCLQQMH